MKTGNSMLDKFAHAKDQLWTMIWLGGLTTMSIWDMLFLNKPAFHKVITGFFNTFTIALLVVAFTFVMSWAITLALHYSSKFSNRTFYILVTFVLNILRSIPQIVGILFGYIGIAALIGGGVIRSPFVIFILMSICMSLFIIVELVDLMRERIEHFQKLDFYNAMRVCGISENRVINFHILWKNSRLHIFNKLISIFGSAVFLQCSVDFIISVGLSTDVNAVMLPPTLGSLLATMDSKQDILAIGSLLTNPGYLPKLFTLHLQGMTVAFTIVFTLMCIFIISNRYAERHRL